MPSKKYTSLFLFINGIPLVIGFFVGSPLLFAVVPLSFYSVVFLWKHKEYIGAAWFLLIGLIALAFIATFKGHP